MKKGRNVVLVLLVVGPPVLYFFLRTWVVANWGSIEPLLALASYWWSLILWLYISNLRFHFFVKRLLMFFKYDHTTWIVSARYDLADERSDMLGALESYLRTVDCRVERRELDFVKVLWKNKHLLRFRETRDQDARYLFFDTSAIDVPMRQNGKIIGELSKLLESVESLVRVTGPSGKRYEVDIEYAGKSPYYSFWVRKLPEEIIHNFNCSIRLPDDKDDQIRVNKNHLIIQARQLQQLFRLTLDYVSLKTA